jgi:xanthine/uracil/vitamin C permease (AzgA family)
VRKLPGAIIARVLAVTVAAVALGLEPWHGIAAVPPSLAPTFLQMDLAGVFQLGLVTIVLTLLLVTILDTAGTLIGVARQAGFLAPEGRLPRARADDAQLFDRHRHRPRLDRLCGVKALSGRAREVNAAVAIIAAAFLLKLIFA